MAHELRMKFFIQVIKRPCTYPAEDSAEYACRQLVRTLLDWDPV